MLLDFDDAGRVSCEPTMTKAELVRTIAEIAELDKRKAGLYLDAVLQAVEDALRKGETVSLPGFGAFSIGERTARIARNPGGGPDIQVPDRRVVKFKAGSRLKDAVNH